MREYGPEAVAAEMAKAHAARAFGADYVAHILRQQQPRREVQPPLQLRDSARNELAPDPLSLAEYDAFILRFRKESRDLTASETEPAQLDLYGPSTGPDGNGRGFEESHLRRHSGIARRWRAPIDATAVA